MHRSAYPESSAHLFPLLTGGVVEVCPRPVPGTELSKIHFSELSSKGVVIFAIYSLNNRFTSIYP